MQPNSSLTATAKNMIEKRWQSTNKKLKEEARTISELSLWTAEKLDPINSDVIKKFLLI